MVVAIVVVVVRVVLVIAVVISVVSGLKPTVLLLSRFSFVVRCSWLVEFVNITCVVTLTNSVGCGVVCTITFLVDNDEVVAFEKLIVAGNIVEVKLFVFSKFITGITGWIEKSSSSVRTLLSDVSSYPSPE